MPPVHKRLHIHLDATLQAQGFKLPKKQKHQKATLAELLTLAIFFLLQGQDRAKGYLAAKSTLKAYFPSLPHLSRFYRVLQKAQSILAYLAIRLAGGWVSSRWWTSSPSPSPTATASTASPFLRFIWGRGPKEAAVEVGPLGAFGGYVLTPVMNERGLFWNLAPSGLTRWALLPGNARETWGRDLVADLPAVLGDRGFRWVQGFKTPSYGVRGGRVVKTGWRG
jgi:hypothetical protein